MKGPGGRNKALLPDLPHNVKNPQSGLVQDNEQAEFKKVRVLSYLLSKVERTGK